MGILLTQRIVIGKLQLQLHNFIRYDLDRLFRRQPNTYMYKCWVACVASNLSNLWSLRASDVARRSEELACGSGEPAATEGKRD